MADSIPPYEEFEEKCLKAYAARGVTELEADQRCQDEFDSRYYTNEFPYYSPTSYYEEGPAVVYGSAPKQIIFSKNTKYKHSEETIAGPKKK